jgi:tetratricopeptide (TPR) repeat protein
MSWAKVLQFVLKNWRELLVIFSLSLVSLKMRLDYNALNKAYEISKQETEERIEALQYIHSEELARREQAIETYKEALKELRDDYEESQDNLEREKQKKTKEYERQFSQDKEALADEIISTFDFEYVE